MIRFGIIHAVHRSRPTLPDCVASLYAAGAEEIRIFPDNGRHGALGNMRRAILSLAHDNHPWESHICVVDDDLILHESALSLVHRAIRANPGVVLTMYTVEQNIPHELRTQSGWVEAPVNVHTWGGVIVMPVSIAYTVAVKMREDMEKKRLLKAPDAAMYEAIEQLGLPVLHHLPSLVQDIGDGASTLGNEHTPDTKGFRWNEWATTEP